MQIAHQPPLPQRRLAGLGLTVLVHAALLLGWQMAGRLPLAMPEAPSRTIQWLRLPLPVAAPAAPALPAPRSPETARRAPRAASATENAAPVPAAITPPPASSTEPPAQAVPAASAAPATPAAPAAGLVQRALRDAGAADRALRKENRAYITAPLDSPQIRLRQGIEAAADLAPNKWYEAPKVQELVNNTGDGARRTRVVTAGGTYCVTEVSNRAPNSIDLINIWGKQRLTNCPEHETPAKAQEWRTARD